MRRLLCLYTLVLTLAAGPAMAQTEVWNQGVGRNSNYNKSAGVDTLEWRTSVSLMPLSLFASGLELALEFRFPGPNTSLRINGGYFLDTKPWFYQGTEGHSDLKTQDYYGYRVEAQYRFHLLRRSDQASGYYLGPYAQVKYINLSGDSVWSEPTNVPPFNLEHRTAFTAATLGIGAGVLVGRQWRFQNRIMLDVYMGGGVMIPGDKRAADIVHITFVNPYNRGIQLHGGLGIGYLPETRYKTPREF